MTANPPKKSDLGVRVLSAIVMVAVAGTAPGLGVGLGCVCSCRGVGRALGVESACILFFRTIALLDLDGS